MANDCRMITRIFALNSTNVVFHMSNLCQEVKNYSFSINTILNTTLTRKEGCYDAKPVVSLLQLTNLTHANEFVCKQALYSFQILIHHLVLLWRSK
jgi:hypothetical protein